MKRIFATVGFLASVCGWPHLTVADTSCVPSATVSGDAALVADVVAHLDQMGVGSDSAAATCPRIEATVVHDGTSVTVSVRDAFGVVETRVVTDARIAATWIQSWCRSDIPAPLLVPAVLPPPAPVSTRVSSTGSEPRDTVSVPAPLAGASFAPRWSGAAMYESSDANDGSSWSGVSASACVLTGGVCFGALARYATNPKISITDELTFADRTNIDLVATAAIPFTVGRATVVPMAGVGIGRLRTARHEPAVPPEPDPNDPCGANMAPDDPAMCPVDLPYYIGDGFAATHWGMRLEAQVTLSVPLGKTVFLDLGAGVSLLPGSHKDAYAPPPPEIDPDLPPNGDPTDPMDPNLPPDPNGDTDPFYDPLLELPGEPGRLIRFAIGLRVELP